MYYLVVERISKFKYYPQKIIKSNKKIHVGKDKKGYFQYGEYKKWGKKYWVFGCYKKKKKAEKHLFNCYCDAAMLASM